MTALDLRTIARALGGEVSGRRVLAPGPEHSPKDRSLCVSLAPSCPAASSSTTSRATTRSSVKIYVRARLGLPAWQPGDKQDRCSHLCVTQMRLLRPTPFACYTDRERVKMATPGQLVDGLAVSLGIPVATVIQYDRQLAESGLRTKWGRGRSAAAVTSQDAANLLIAIAASPLAGPTVKEAVRTCEAYGSLQVLQRASWIDKFPKLGLPTLATLPPSHSLRKALSVVIDGVGKGEIFQIPGRQGPRTADFSFAVRFEGPEPWAEIVADGSLGEGKPSQTARLVYTSASAAKGFRKKRPKGPDLHQTRSISFATIRALGCLIARDPT
jgi:hypothetical protein